MTENEYEALAEKLERAEVELLEAEQELCYAEEEAMSCENWQQECQEKVHRLRQELAIADDEFDPAGDADDLLSEED